MSTRILTKPSIYIINVFGQPRALCDSSNLSPALCSRFKQTQDNEEVKEAITLCQESLAALSLLHPDRYFSYMRLQVAYLQYTPLPPME
ncbi:hypothetical protein C8R48DRAFT_464080 [Suillus tomentosus]|nr:hypothetical protein C8R48DRAFT_464080 [Suillus tomentosus]